MTKICNTCGQEKHHTEFPKNGTDRQGNTRRRPDCNVCYKVKRKTNKKKFNKFKNNVRHRTEDDVKILTLEEWKEANIFFKGECCYCGHEPKKRGSRLTKEHLVAIAHGGTHTAENIIPACKSCNSSKSDKPFAEWFRKQHFYDEERHRRIMVYVQERGGNIESLW